MSDENNSSNHGAALTRRHFLSAGGAALAAAATVPLVAQSARPAGVQIVSPDHHLPNEKQPGPVNDAVDAENPNTVWPPMSDNGSVSPFKYSFGLSHKEIDSGGWTRQVTVRDLPVSKRMAGVEMYLTPGGIRELHWHVQAEWRL
jgi:oxalate decarboxylase